MQFSEQWLRTLCNPALDSAALCHLLTMAGLEVEETAAVAPPFTGVVVGQIVSFEKHPNADKLKVCKVDVGQGEPLQIVCGAPNVVVGMKAPCATVGAKLPEFEIKAAKLRGVESFGMMCSADELGMSQDHDGLLVLADDAPVGANLRDVLGLDDISITIKLTPNRADCLSLAGVARELAALTGAPSSLPFTPAGAPSHDVRRAVLLDDPKGCPLYCGRVIHDVNPAAPTPVWMRQRLERSGLRSISAIVDVTNYVMLELGQPLHAFDDDKLHGTIHVRRPQAGEKLKLLNEQEIELTADQLLIADEARPLALAGVMGGADSGVTDATRNVFLESAYFNPDVIVGRARALGFSSDASHRFERGVDPQLAPVAMERATALILEICGGSAGPVVEAIQAAEMPTRSAVSFRPARARAVLGIELAEAVMRDSLARLGMQIETQGEAWAVTPPSYRFDIQIEEDLIEEVARVYGYDNIPALPPAGLARILPQAEAQRPVHRLRRLLAAQDYHEAISYAFVEEAWEADFAGNTQPVRLANPIVSQLAVMRSSLIGGLVGALITNQRRRASRVRLFEVGRCFKRVGAGQGEVDGFEQPVHVAALAWGPAEPEQWGVKTRRVDFFDVKGDLESVLANKAEFAPAQHPAFHPGRCASVAVGGRQIGVIGELHPAWVQKYDLGQAPVLFELTLDAALAAHVTLAEEVSRLPSVTRDLALVMKHEVSAGQLLAALRAKAPEIVHSIELFDVYTGPGVPDEHKSLALRVLLQHAERTLSDSEIEAAMNGLLQVASTDFSARLR